MIEGVEKEIFTAEIENQYLTRKNVLSPTQNMQLKIGGIQAKIAELQNFIKFLQEKETEIK